MEQRDKPPAAKEPGKPAQYQRPKLTRWGTLRELTAGGGGKRAEAVTKRNTRF
jgi:hypothetical protein